MSTDDVTPGPVPEHRDEPEHAARGGSPWAARLLWSAVAVLLVAALVVLAGATLPRWWAERIADRVQDSTSSGVAWGLFYGFGFTLVPLLALLLVGRRWGARAALAMVVLALLAATPNWLTLAVVLGTNEAATDGSALMDADAPGFRGATAVGALVAVLLVLVAFALLGSARRRRRQVHELRAELARRDERPGPERPGPERPGPEDVPGRHAP